MLLGRTGLETCADQICVFWGVEGGGREWGRVGMCLCVCASESEREREISQLIFQFQLMKNGSGDLTLHACE